MRKLTFIFFACFLVVFILSADLLAKQEQRLALLIGNSNYTHGGSLPNPVNDVRAMKEALEGLGFTVMKFENCSQKTMKWAMDDFGRKLKGHDVGLFFYAGHGVRVKGNNFLLPIDAKLDNENDAEYDCVRADRVLAKMETAGSRTNIVILDACRDNPFVRSWRRGTGGGGLEFMNAPSGSLIAYSTAPGKTALDGDSKNSPYSSALLQHINTPNTTVIEMFQAVRSTVIANSEGSQIPWESTSLRGNFYFNNQAGVKVKHQKEAVPKTVAKLFVITEPEDAIIRILNIKPRFYQGMELEPGQYHLKVLSNGYSSKKMWATLRTGEIKKIHVDLEKAQRKLLSSEDVERFTTKNTVERTAALVARDWPQLEKIARNYIQVCQGGCDAASLSYAFAGIAIANLEMFRFLDALESANSCIESYYANPLCHFLKVKALIAIDRIVEAQATFRIAERLVSHSLSKTESDLRSDSDSSYRESLLAYKNEYEAIEKQLNSLRARLFRD
jgi:hypothetical protein